MKWHEMQMQLAYTLHDMTGKVITEGILHDMT